MSDDKRPLRRRRPPAEGFFGTDRRGDLHEGIHRSLIHAIASGRYPPGSRLPSEPDLAQTFSVSRPVVRQAMEKLRSEGFIHSRPGSGTYVAPLDDIARRHLSDPALLGSHVLRMQQDLEFRLVYEPEAARFAAERIDAAGLARIDDVFAAFRRAHDAGQLTHHHDFLFHQAIAIVAGNPHFTRATEELEFGQEATWLVIRPLVFFVPGPAAEEVLAEHAEVLSLIRARDPKAARDAMAHHLRSAQDRLRRYFSA